jgi:hypothetical protein
MTASTSATMASARGVVEPERVVLVEDLGGLVGSVIGVMVLLGIYRVLLKGKERPLAR